MRVPPRLLVLPAALLLAACGGTETSDASRALPTIPPSPEAVAATSTGETVVVTPSSASIQVGSSVQFTAKAYNSTGALRQYAIFDWSSTNTGIATVDTMGRVKGLAAGTSTIKATTRYSKVTGTAALTVTSVTAPPPPPPSGTETLIAAGDIGVCSTNYDQQTANLIDNIPGTVAPLGDLAYPDGTASDFTNCYDPSWGRHKARTRPAIGNHEYVSGGGAYWNYFGALAGPSWKGYYSYNLGDWHIIVLNSNCQRVSCSVGSAQEQWLRADLAANTKSCVLAYWHHPRFSSNANSLDNTSVDPFWNALYQYKADVILNGHVHLYERFGLQNPSGVADANGIRQFIVATGGKAPFYVFGTPKPNSQVRHNATHGVLKLTLGTGTYSWNFVPVAGKTWTDSGSTACH